MPHFLGRLEPTRPEMPNDPTPEEMEVVGRHFQYYSDGVDSGKVLLAGRTLSEKDVFGICIIEADTLEEARDWAAQDPCIREGVMRLADLQPFGVALWSTTYDPS